MMRSPITGADAGRLSMILPVINVDATYRIWEEIHVRANNLIYLNRLLRENGKFMLAEQKEEAEALEREKALVCFDWLGLAIDFADTMLARPELPLLRGSFPFADLIMELMVMLTDELIQLLPLLDEELKIAIDRLRDKAADRAEKLHKAISED